MHRQGRDQEYYANEPSDTSPVLHAGHALEFQTCVETEPIEGVCVYVCVFDIFI